eukprot:m51a1_g8653 hypothetical protein (206) ;mRNA; r:41091-42087
MGHSAVAAIVCLVCALASIGLGIASLAPDTVWFRLEMKNSGVSYTWEETASWYKEDDKHPDNLRELYKGTLGANLIAIICSGVLAILIVLVLAFGKAMKKCGCFIKLLMVIVGVAAFAGFVFAFSWHAANHAKKFKEDEGLLCSAFTILSADKSPCDSYMGKYDKIDASWHPLTGFALTVVAAATSLVASLTAMGITPKSSYLSF